MMQFLAVAVFTSKREQPDIYESKRTTEKTNLIEKKVNIGIICLDFMDFRKSCVTLEKSLYSFLQKCILVFMNFALTQIILRLPTLILIHFQNF